MLKAKKKLSQKEIKKDKLVTAYFESKEWVANEENKKRLYLAGGIIVLIAAVIFFYVTNQKAKNEEAEAKLSSVITLYDNGDYNAAINGDPASGTSGLIEITNNYGSTESGETAKFFLANSYYNLKDYDNALKYFNDYSGDNELLHASSLSGIGSIHEARGDYKTAAEYFEKASKSGKELILTEENLYYALRAYAHAGDKENAKRVYDILKRDYPKTKFAADLKRIEPRFLN